MPRKLTIECTCDRCSRVWYEDYVEGEELPEAHALAVMLTGPGTDAGKKVRKVTFDALCSSCLQTIDGYIDKMGELQKKSPSKAEAKKEPAPKDRPSTKATQRGRASSPSAS